MGNRGGHLARRVLSLVCVLLLVSVATFSLLNLLPGDPAVTIVGPRATPADLEAVRTDLGLDRPVAERYVTWLGRAVQGDLGVSYQTNEPVAATLRARLPVSLELVLAAQLIALVVSVPAALWSASRRNSAADRVVAALSFAGFAVPPFGVGVALMLLFSVKLGWFPANGYVPLSESVTGNLRSLTLPAITLALPLGAIYTRVLRANLIETLAADHIMMATANGLPRGRVLVNHGLRQSSLVLLTVVGLNFSALLGGAVVVESLFALPGVGRSIFLAIGSRDYLVVQGAVGMIAVAYVLVNLAVDALANIADPRLRRGDRPE